MLRSYDVYELYEFLNNIAVGSALDVIDTLNKAIIIPPFSPKKVFGSLSNSM